VDRLTSELSAVRDQLCQKEQELRVVKQELRVTHGAIHSQK
jgi:hypothetical protein